MRALSALLFCALLLAACAEREPQPPQRTAGDTAAVGRGDTARPVANARVYDIKSGTLVMTNSLQPGIEQTLRFDDYGGRVALEARQEDTVVVQISANGRDVMYNTLDRKGVSRPILGRSYFLKNFLPDLRSLDSAGLARLEGSTLLPRTIAGEECRGRRFRYNGRAISVWDWRGVPMRVEIEERAERPPLVIEVKTIEEEEIPERYFTVPPEIEVVSIDGGAAKNG